MHPCRHGSRRFRLFSQRPQAYIKPYCSQLATTCQRFGELSLLCEVETAEAISLNDPDEAFNRNHSLTGSWDYFGLDEKDSLAEHRETTNDMTRYYVRFAGLPHGRGLADCTSMCSNVQSSFMEADHT